MTLTHTSKSQGHNALTRSTSGQVEPLTCLGGGSVYAYPTRTQEAQGSIPRPKVTLISFQLNYFALFTRAFLGSLASLQAFFDLFSIL